jgi:hypothetical protein
MGVTSADDRSAEIRTSQNPSKYRPAHAVESAVGIVSIATDGVMGDIVPPLEHEITTNVPIAHINAVCKIYLMEFILLFLILNYYTTKY